LLVGIESGILVYLAPLCPQEMIFS
jgi:hypothetical protein